MDDGGVDTTVIESWQHKIVQMVKFPPLKFNLRPCGMD
jgi:hypothetical protein